MGHARRNEKNSEDFYKMLKIPHEVVAIVSGALYDAAKKYDLEGSFPASNTYRVYRLSVEKIGNSLLTKKSNDKPNFAHMLNSTLTATERTMCCIPENYQKEDGVEIPDVLRDYMGGKNFLPFKNDPGKETKGK